MKAKLLLAICFIAFVTLGISSITKHENKLKFKDIELKSTRTDLIETEAERDLLNKKFEDILQSKKIDEEQFKKLQEENKALQEREAELRKQVKAKEAQKLAEAQKLQQTASMSVKAYAASSCSDAKSCIYQKESGNNPGAINKSSGACGIGQAWPCSKMPCSLSDYSCQDKYFTKYAVDRYGSWDKAWSFWQANKWW